MTGFLLDPRAGWRDDPMLCKDVTLGTVLRLHADSDEERPLADPYGSFGGLADPTGAAAGRDRAYLVDRAKGRVLGWDDCADPPGFAKLTSEASNSVAPLDCLSTGAFQTDQPRGAAVTPSDDLVVVDSGHRRLLVLAAGGSAVRRIIGPPPAYPQWTPWDVAVTARGRLLVTDHSGGLVHVLTCDGNHLAAWDGAGDDPAVPPLVAPTAVAVDRDGRIYVAQDGDPVVRVLDQAGHVIELRETTQGLAERFCPPAFGVAPDGTITLASLIPPPLPRYALTGTFLTAALDSRLHRCVWHRLRLDARVPAGTNVTVHALTADVPLSGAEVAALPDDRWRGGQVHGVVGEAPWDCLLLTPPGRYLWLRLTLTGSGAGTPEVRTVTVDYPRMTSARFLPAAFREEPVSADFTERFVALLDRVRETVTQKIGGFAALLDPYAAPDGTGGTPDFLGWLASWLGLATDLRLPPQRRRRLVAEAHRLYRLRGTPAGIVAHLEICLGVPVRLLEDFTLRRWLFVGSGRLGDRAAVWDAEVVSRLQLDTRGELGGVALVGSTDPLRDPIHVYAHRFRVYVPTAESDDLRRLAERVVELAKPAHTHGSVVFVAARMRVGVQAFVGVDSVIGAVPDRPGNRLGNDTLLGTPARPSMRVGRTTRVGTSTVLD
jgi:phage tail-like protein